MNRAIILVLCLFGLAALSPAPIKRVGDIPHVPSQTQDQVEAQQRLQKVLAEVGSVPQREEQPVQENPSDLTARQIVQSTPVPREEGAAQANKVLKEVDREIKESQFGGFKSVLVLCIILLLLASGLYAGKRWLDKQFPYSRRKRRAAMRKA